MKYVHICPNHKETIYTLDEKEYTRHCPKCHSVMRSTNINSDEFLESLELDFEKRKYISKKINIIHDYIQCEQVKQKRKPQTEKQIAVNNFVNFVLKYKIFKERTTENRCPICGSLEKYKRREHIGAETYIETQYYKTHSQQKYYYKCDNCGFSTKKSFEYTVKGVYDYKGELIHKISNLDYESQKQNRSKKNSTVFKFFFSIYLYFIILISTYIAFPSFFISFIFTCIAIHFIKKIMKKIL